VRRISGGLLFLAGAASALVFLTSCSHQNEEYGEVAKARKHLHSAPCSSVPAVAGAAGVNSDPREVYLDDWLVISVCHLDEFMKAAATQQQKVHLYINGRDSGNEPSGVDLDGGVLVFELSRYQSNKDLWQPLLYNPLFDHISTLQVSVGAEGERPLPRAERANLMLRLNKLYLDVQAYLWFGVLLAVMVLLIGFARRSDMLRTGPSVAGVHQSYSLARTQMAWWFFLTLAGYIFIWLVTSDRDSIPASLLGMLGISAGTAVAAVAVAPETSGGAKRREVIDAEIASVDTAKQQVTADLNETKDAALRASLEKKLVDLDQRRDALVNARANLSTMPPSSGFWKDLVRDDRGAFAFDRFQMVVWSIVMGGVFLYEVLWNLTMPEFSATTLALMGISAGTYIGFRLPQQGAS